MFSLFTDDIGSFMITLIHRSEWTDLTLIHYSHVNYFFPITAAKRLLMREKAGILYINELMSMV